MCGIVGAVSWKSGVDPVKLASMRDAMYHRGPDGEGLWVSKDGRVGLGHRRLAIVDLSQNARQPMSGEDGQVHLVFNGEIYNHLSLRRKLIRLGFQFRSTSDTEILLASYRAWGTDCLRRLNGMFSFAVYDSNAQSLFLARDRAGEKPMFYLHEESRFLFASELKALLRDGSVPRHINTRSLEFYFTFGYVPGEHCLLEGMNKLPPGHALTLDLQSQKKTMWRYWTLPRSVANEEESASHLVDELDSLLEDSVQRQLVADVPVGILLSGGVDSSLVTAMASRVSSQRVKTFTIRFPGAEGRDEGPFARIVAKHFGTEHTELTAEEATVELLPVLARQYDEPMCDSSMVPTFLVSQLVRRQAKVALGGDGGDELFGGYSHYSWLHRQRELRKWLPAWARRVAMMFSARFLPLGIRGRTFLLGLSGELNQSIANVNLFFDPRARQELVVPLRCAGNRVQGGAESYRGALCDRARGFPGEAMAADFCSYLVEDILVKVDRASMLASLEVRAPWLDYRIIEFAFRKVPNKLRASRGGRKIIPRLLARRLLPPSLEIDRKQGFSIPMERWFRGRWGRFTEEVLLQADPAIFDRSMIKRLIRGQRLGYSNGERLFALTMFELWRREYNVGLS